MTEKPEVKIRVSPEGIPSELKALPRWVVWKHTWSAKTNRWVKVPYKFDGAYAKSSDPATWGAFEGAMAVVEDYDGLGFVFNGDGITGIDLDGLIDDDGAYSEKALHILAQVPGYAELSPSGRGLHIITRTEPIGDGKRKDGVEAYSTGRYFTFTGCQVNGHAALPEMRQDIRPFLAEHFGVQFEEKTDLDVALAETPRTFYQKVNALAMKAFAAWVPALFPDAIPYQKGGYRVTSVSLGRQLEEDISIVAEGIKDFGVADQGDKREGRRSPIDLVIEWQGAKDAQEAANWLCSCLGVNPAAMGGKTAADPPKVSFVQAAQFASAQKVEWHIKHVLPQRGLIVIYGEPGSSKSFFALDMVAHVARGLEWRGHRVRQSKVAYIAAEGVAGFGNRLAAYARHSGADLSEVPVFVRGGAFDLKDMYLEACAEINAISEVGIVVIDTLAAVTAGGNENTSEDMGAAIDAAQRIIQATGASVILIHHTNNQGAMRGWSGLRGAVDNQIRIENDKGLRTAYIEKQKEGEDGKGYGYRLKVIELYLDEDGDPVTSCVVTEDEQQAPSTKGKKTRKSTGGDFATSDKYAKARKYLQIIEETAGLGGANIDEIDVISAIQGDETVNPLKEPEYPRPDNIKRTLLTLAEQGKIKREGRWIRVCG